MGPRRLLDRSTLDRERLTRLGHPTLRAFWRKRRQFLGQFVTTNDLVYDVGANVGDYTKTFAELGARPIAIEPLPHLAASIRERVGGALVIEAAASDTQGSTAIHFGARDAEATVSPRYARIVEREQHVSLRSLTVETVTLDAIAAMTGEPSFVKIDVEGHEPAVLAGMTFNPAALSFEVHGTLLDEASECLATLENRGYRFRLSPGKSFEWSGDWSNADATLATITRLAAERSPLFADVYATAPSTQPG